MICIQCNPGRAVTLPTYKNSADARSKGARFRSRKRLSDEFERDPSLFWHPQAHLLSPSRSLATREVATTTRLAFRELMCDSLRREVARERRF